MTPFLTNLLSSVSNIGSSIGANFMNEYFYRLRNRHLTGKEVEQNAFNAQQAQINRDFEERMSNTANQRAVEDMENAGLNPALMYGNGSAASTPTGSNAQGTASVNSPEGISSIIGAIQEMKLTQSEIALRKSQENLNNAKARESEVSAEQIVEQTVNIRKQRGVIDGEIKKLDLDNKEKEILLNYTDEMENAKLENLKADLTTKEAQVKKFNQEVSNLKEENKKIVQETINLKEQVDLMLSQETLNYEQAKQCNAMIGQINQNVEILKKDNSHYDWNHMKTLSFKDGVAVVSDANGGYAGSFTGPSAAIRGAKNNKRDKRW